MAQTSAFLNKILTQIELNQKQQGRSLVVFDLDSTLFDVGPRLEKILIDFADVPQHQIQFPEQTKIIKTLKIHKNDWGVKDTLIRAGFNHEHQDLQQAMKEFWLKTFFSNEYLKYDRPYPGAVEFVQKIEKLGAEIAYLTGRDIHRMGTGSVETLKQWNFPLDDSKAKLILKPHRSMDDGEFKKDWFLALEPDQYSHIWFFENEPVNINLIQIHLPHVQLVFFDSTHSKKEQPPENIPSILHFLTGIK